jgi:hypothetical protein
MKRNLIILQNCFIFIFFLAGCAHNNPSLSLYQDRLTEIINRSDFQWLDFSPTGHWVILNHGWSSRMNELKLIDIETQNEVTVSLPIPAEGYCDKPSFSPRDDALILVCQTKGGLWRDDYLIRLDLADSSSIIPDVLETQLEPGYWNIVWDSTSDRFCAFTSKYGMVIFKGTEVIRQIQLDNTNGIRVIFIDNTIYIDVRKIPESGISNHMIYALPEPYDLPLVEVFSYVTDFNYSFWTDSQKEQIVIPWNDITPEGDDRLMFTVLSAQDGHVIRQIKSPLLGQVRLFAGQDHLFFYQINEQDESRIDNRLYAMSWRNFRFTSQDKPNGISYPEGWKELYQAIPVWFKSENKGDLRLMNFEK